MTKIIDKMLNEKLFFSVSEPHLAAEKIKEICTRHGRLKEKEDRMLSDGPILKTISKFNITKTIDSSSRIVFFFDIEGIKKDVGNTAELSVDIQVESVLAPKTTTGFFSGVFRDFYMSEIYHKRNMDKIANEEAKKIIQEINDEIGRL
ncbi:MAG: hypothetical protein B6U68_04625 [Candidatus Aenigmarchaeota archaeon ex4484_14]|nr:MAG: hypothetical protein B6U68_04625 [Candidatus Aenigmarchaeota archaeon ex4484_14]